MKKSIAQYAKDAKAAASRAGDSAKELGRNVGNAVVVKAESTGSSIAVGMKTASVALDDASSVVASGARRSATSAKNAAVATGNALATGFDVVKRSAATAAIAAFDQNGDGKFDQDDIKIMAQKGVEAAKVVANEAGDLAKSVAKSGLVKDTAAAAAVGAVVASALPLIGTATGAAVGAVLGAYSHVKSK